MRDTLNEQNVGAIDNILNAEVVHDVSHLILPDILHTLNISLVAIDEVNDLIVSNARSVALP